MYFQCIACYKKKLADFLYCTIFNLTVNLNIMDKITLAYNKIIKYNR
jgi:hypothetical protein